MGMDEQSHIRDFWIGCFRMMTIKNCHMINAYDIKTALKNLERLEDVAKHHIEQTFSIFGVLDKVNIKTIMLCGSYAMGIDHDKSDINFALDVETTLNLNDLEKMLNDSKKGDRTMSIDALRIHVRLFHYNLDATNDKSLSYYLRNEMKRLWQSQHQPLDNTVMDFLGYMKKTVDFTEPITNNHFKIDDKIGDIVDKLSHNDNLTHDEIMHMLRIYQAANMKLCCKLDMTERRLKQENVKALIDENEQLKAMIERNDEIIEEQSKAIKELQNILERYQLMCLPSETPYAQ